MKTIKFWIEAMRLRTLPVSLAGVVLGTGYALTTGTVRWVAVVLCFAVALLAQIASNFANEYYDYVNGLDRIGREGPRRGVTEGDISPRAMKVATFVTLALACCAGLALIPFGSWWLIGVGIAVAIGVLAYSTGPYPLSHHGLGEVAVIIFFGLVPVNFTCWLACGEWSIYCLMGSVSIGLLGANVLIVNNYRDADDDRQVGKNTLAVILGKKVMPWVYALNALWAMGLMITAWSAKGLLFVPIVFAAIFMIPALMMPKLTGCRLTPLLGITSVLMFVYALIFAFL
ncbi:MAG: 1,4-dihydroxy-2-naphthoate octaprenyltransferase [Bacteroides sp.]|nr:1,4-dihydroxy-2-naphthoate octaprenyltransferase [Bacteroides sp.]